MENDSERFCRKTCRDIVHYHFRVRSSIQMRLLLVQRHFFWQKRQEMRQRCGYPRTDWRLCINVQEIKRPQSLHSRGILVQARPSGQNNKQHCHHAYACQCRQRETVPEHKPTDRDNTGDHQDGKERATFAA